MSLSDPDRKRVLSGQQRATKCGLLRPIEVSLRSLRILSGQHKTSSQTWSSKTNKGPSQANTRCSQANTGPSQADRWLSEANTVPYQADRGLSQAHGGPYQANTEPSEATQCPLRLTSPLLSQKRILSG